jgi:transmembrane protein TMEM260 (protein O-mannosyltransferase)
LKPKLFWASGLATLFLVAHLAFLPSTLEDIDSLNFALGLHDFDPTKHQPHPPGYPIFMALGKLARAVVPSDPKALATLGAIFGALAVFPLVALFGSIEALEPQQDRTRPVLASVLATVLVIASPLYWFNALRPMSDIPGLAVTLAAQAALAAAYVRQRMDPSRTPEALEASGKMIVLGAFLAAIAIGFRSQAAVLTLPLLMVVLLQRAGRGAAGALLGSAMTFSIGLLLWAIPLVVASGGLAAYRNALSSQGSEDFGGVDMLYRNPTPRRLAIGLLQTFIYPWASTPLGCLVFALAAVGMAVLLWRARRAAILVIALALPYAIFHLVFQETVTTRYALPLIPVMAFLAVRGLRALEKGAGAIFSSAAAVAAIVIWSLALTLPAARVYAHDGSPAFAALAELHRLLDENPKAAVGMHQGILRSVQTQDFGAAKVLKAPPMREWLELAAYWRDGNTVPVWFLADPARTDIELIDPLSRTLHGRYVWHFARQNFMSGVRPDIVDLVSIDSPPGWFGEEGWHLTSETLNMSERRGKHEAIAYLRSRPDPALLAVGGENGGTDAHISLTIEDRVIDRWDVPAGGTFFRRMMLPAGSLAGEGTFKRLAVSYANPDGTPEKIRLTQFALEPPGEVFFVQQAGWNEIEYNRDMQRRWRWTTDRAVTFINSGGRDVTVAVAGESPLTYFDGAPHVAIRAGTQVLATATPSSDFELTARVPAATLAAADGMVTIETDKTFVPYKRSGSPDKRTLGLRILKFEVHGQ